MRISDWSSDVCSSDLDCRRGNDADATQVRNGSGHVGSLGSRGSRHCQRMARATVDTAAARRLLERVGEADADHGSLARLALDADRPAEALTQAADNTIGRAHA